jgi:hypothetical protein
VRLHSQAIVGEAGGMITADGSATERNTSISRGAAKGEVSAMERMQ